MSIIYSAIPATTPGLTEDQAETLRAVLPEEVVQAIGRAIYSGSESSAVNAALEHGADPTGVLDSSAAIQAAIDAGGSCRLPAGTYRIESTLVITSVRPYRFFGDGVGETLIVWDGAAGEDMLRIENSQYVEVSDMELRGNTTTPPRACLYLMFDEDDYAYVPFNQNIYRMWLGAVGANTGLMNMCEYGILIDNGTSVLDYNNSEHNFDHVDIECCSEAGIKINQNQAKTLVFRRCNISTAPIGVDCQDGAFSWYNGNINCDVDDKSGICFELAAPNDGILIEGMNSENTGRLLRTGNGVYGGSGWPITFRNSRFAGNEANPDGVIIEHTFRGPLIIEGCLFDAWEEIAGTPLQFTLGSSIATAKVVIRGNEFNGTDSYTNSIVKDGAALGVIEEDNVYFDTGAGSFFPRAHSGTLDFVEADASKAHTFEIPVHLGAAAAIPYTITCTVSERTGSTEQVLEVTKTATGFTVYLDGTLGAGETLSIDWQLRWK